MLKRIFFCISLFFLSVSGFAQLGRYGYPIVQSYAIPCFENNGRYRSITQDARGVIYAANENGILEFNGTEYNEIPVRTCERLESIATSPDGEVYYGGTDDFGVLTTGNKGRTVAQSFRNMLPDTSALPTINVGIYFHGDHVYFSGTGVFIDYDKAAHKFTRWPTPVECRAVGINGKFFTSKDKSVLCRLDSAGVHPVTFAPKINSDLVDLIQIRSNEFLFLFTDKLLKYNKTLLRFEPTEIKTSSSIFHNQTKNFAHIEQLNDGKFAISSNKTDDDYAILVVDSLMNLLSVFNTQNEFANNYTTNMSLLSNMLWVPHSTLTRLDFKFPIRSFGANSGLVSYINGFSTLDGLVYAACDNGMYYEAVDANNITYFKHLGQLNSGYCYQITKLYHPYTGEDVLVAVCELGSFIILRDGISRLNSFKSYQILQPSWNRHYVYTNTYRKLNRSFINPDATVTMQKTWNEVEDVIVAMQEDPKEHDVWIQFKNQGIAYLDSTENLKFVSAEQHGINSFSHINGRMYFHSDTCSFTFDKNTQKFSHLYLLDQNSNRKVSIKKVWNLAPGISVVKTNTNACAFWHEGKLYDNLFKRITSSDVLGDFILARDSTIWFCSHSKVYSYRPKNLDINEIIKDDQDCLEDFNCYISEIFNGDSLFCTDKERMRSSDTKITFDFEHNDIRFKFMSPYFVKEMATTYSYILEGSMKEWSKPTKNNTAIFRDLNEGTYTFRVKAINVYGHESSEATFSFTITPPFYRSIHAYVLYFLAFLLFSFLLVRFATYRHKQQNKEMEALVEKRTAEILQAKEKIERQHDEIMEKDEEIQSSIRYASLIQSAALMPTEQIQKLFNNSFLMFSPQQSISGDFYWFRQIGKYKYSAVVDCTGHGIPGGFLSMLGISFLNQIVKEDLHTDEILNRLRESIITNLNQNDQDDHSNRDGMDIALYRLDTTTNEIEFSGAYNPLIIIRNNELIEIESDKMPVGIYMGAMPPFTSKTVQLQPGDIVYIFSDGYEDQIGEKTQKKLMRKTFKTYLTEMSQYPIGTQKEMLINRFLEHKGLNEQTDDVTIFGVKI